MDYTGPNSLFIRVLIDKKFELPFKVVDALVFHFIRLSNTYKPRSRHESEHLPVLWHQSLLAFVQRYASDLTPDQKDALLDVIRATSHPQIRVYQRRERMGMSRWHEISGTPGFLIRLQSIILSFSCIGLQNGFTCYLLENSFSTSFILSYKCAARSTKLSNMPLVAIKQAKLITEPFLCSVRTPSVEAAQSMYHIRTANILNSELFLELLATSLGNAPLVLWMSTFQMFITGRTGPKCNINPTTSRHSLFSDLHPLS
ncbi:Bystin-domain-containing protein [Lentinula edodes]|uniref:Bystin-domain-containing protein n=1 Tax=Lentinula edodes TaxID=5353 RepID=A0A1Q3EDS8_LENED|nr:Bystin-domain-containing protein [Lentinula edodes]